MLVRISASVCSLRFRFVCIWAFGRTWNCCGPFRCLSSLRLNSAHPTQYANFPRQLLEAFGASGIQKPRFPLTRSLGLTLPLRSFSAGLGAKQSTPTLGVSALCGEDSKPIGGARNALTSASPPWGDGAACVTGGPLTHRRAANHTIHARRPPSRNRTPHKHTAATTNNHNRN